MPSFQPLETGPEFLRLDGVSLRTPQGVCFRNTNWVWRADEQWALLGPNGSGKSLLARALAGQMPMTRGEILRGFPAPPGRAPEDAVALVSFEQQHEIGLDGVPAARWFTLEHAEVPSVLDFLSRERIEEINPFEVGGPPRRSAAAFARERQRILRLLRIENLIDRDLLALSNGERRKILIARALLKQPRLLILDDPFAGLDVASRRHFRAVIDDLMAGGRVHVLLIALRPEELPSGITHVLHVDRCRVVAAGPKKRTPLPRRKRAAAQMAPVARPCRNASAPVVELRNVNVHYGSKHILRNLSWTVPGGEHWAVLGPNGSGKTTLLSLLTGDNPQAYANDVRVAGFRRGDESIWELRRRVGVVSPDEHLHCDTEASCFDVVCPGWDDPEQDGPTPAQRKAARDRLRELGLFGLRKKAFGELSPGRQRLLLLARALAKDPALLVLDEPGQGLDEVQRRALVRAVEQAMRKGRVTVLYVTHHDDELPQGLAGRLVLDGRGGAAISRVRGATTGRRTPSSSPHRGGRRGTR